MKYNKYCKILLIQNFINNNINATDPIKIECKNIKINIDGKEYYSSSEFEFEITKENLKLRKNIDGCFTVFEDSENNSIFGLDNCENLGINKIYRTHKDSTEKTEVVDITDIKKDDTLYIEYKEFIIINSIKFSEHKGSKVEIVGFNFKEEELETLLNSATEKDFQSNLLNLIKNNPEYEFLDKDKKKFLDEYNNDFFLFSIVCYDDKYNLDGKNSILFNDKYDSPNSKLIDKKK